MVILEIIDGNDEGRIFKIRKESFTVGRDPKNDVVVNDTYMSRQHGEIKFSDGEYLFRDLNSTSGSIIQRGEQCINLDHIWPECKLKSGDRIAIGKTVLSISIAQNGLPQDTAIPTQVFRVSRPPITLSDIEADFQRDRKVLYQLIRLGRRVSLTNATTLEEVFEYASELIFDTFPGSTRITLVLKGEEEETYLPAYVLERSSQKHSRVQDVVTRPVIEHVIKDGVSILFGDLKRECTNYPSLSAADIRSSIFVPLWNGKNILGVLEVDSGAEPDLFTKDDRDIMTMFGFQIALLIDNLMLYQMSLQNALLIGVGQAAAGLSHDIGGLMTAWMSAAAVIEIGLENEKMDYISQGWKILEKKRRALRDLVKDLQYCSKPMVPDFREGDINQLIEESVELQKEIAEQKGVSIELELAPRIPRCCFDSGRLKRVLINLISNAVEAIDNKGGIIRISSEIDTGNKLVSICVTDNGSGIPESSRAVIFNLLYSTKISRGTGLGLAIVKKVIDEHHGRISVKSRVGEGSAFTVSIPLESAKRE